MLAIDTSVKINKFKIFNCLTDSEKETILSYSDNRTYAKHSTVYTASDFADKVYLILKGKVKISKISPEGKEIILAICRAGEVFGEMAILEEDVRNEVAVILEEALIVRVPTVNLKELVVKNAKFNFTLTKLVTHKFKKIQKRLESLVFKSTVERVKEFIKNVAETEGRQLINGTEIEIKLRLTNEEIAKLTSTTRQTVTTTLSNLDKEGVILYDRRRILIKRMDLLN